MGSSIRPAAYLTSALAAVLAQPAYAQSADAAAPATGTPAASQPAAQGPAIGDIVVTARRRAESAQRVPIALTAVTPAQLDTGGVNDLTRVQQVVPSLQLTVVNPRNTNINIRGLGSTPAFSNPGLEYGVGVYALANARLGFTDTRTGLGLHGWVRNAFNKTYPSFISLAAFNTGYAGATFGDPRTYGITASASF